MKKILSLLLTIMALSLPLTANANQGCAYNGNLYPEGSVIGPYICRNGQWVR